MNWVLKLASLDASFRKFLIQKMSSLTETDIILPWNDYRLAQKKVLTLDDLNKLIAKFGP